MKNKVSLIILAAFAACGAMAQNSAPRLVVNITVDRLRTDYLESFMPLYGNSGLRKMLAEGTICTNGSIPFIPNDRASAIAAISTGTTPYYNGITGLRWLDRRTLRTVSCTDNDAANLTSSTLCDELKIASAGKAIVCAVSPFRDAAELSTGHLADGVYWINDQNGQWISSTYYTKSSPSWLTSYNNLYAPTQNVKQTWVPDNTLSGQFNYLSGKKLDKTFKHSFKGEYQFKEFITSALVNEYVTNMALQCIASNGMGIDDISDILNITYYAGTFNDKPVKDCQMELQDTYVRLDKDISNLISSLEKRIGKERILFVLTSTGCDDEEQIDYAKYGIPSGTFYINRTANLMNLYFGALYGQGRYVDGCFRNEIFLNHQLFEQKRVSFSDALDRAHEFLLQAQGVKDVFTFTRLMQADDSPLLNKIRGGYNPSVRGDILVEVAPGWRIYNEETRESYISNAAHPQFPIILYGAGTKATTINTQISVDRIAPTIAKTIHIRAPNACSAEPIM
jgi:hypothetical protein